MPEVPDNVSLDLGRDTQTASMRLEALHQATHNNTVQLHNDISNSLSRDQARKLLVMYENNPANTTSGILGAQASLRFLAYPIRMVDGKFGPETKATLLTFQKDWNKAHPQDLIQSDGLMGRQTANKLILSLNQVSLPKDSHSYLSQKALSVDYSNLQAFLTEVNNARTNGFISEKQSDQLRLASATVARNRDENKVKSAVALASAPKSVPKLDAAKVKAGIENVKRIQGHYEILKKFNPNAYAEARANHPKFIKAIDDLSACVATMDASVDYTPYIEEYNSLVTCYEEERQKVLTPANEDVKKAVKTEIINGMQERPTGDLDIAQDQQAALLNLSRDLYTAFFPESNVDYAVRFYTGQEALEPWQKLALAVPNGLESAAHGFVSLANPNTYKEIHESYQVFSSLSAQDKRDIYNAMKLAFANMDKVTNLATVISFLTSFLFIGGMTKKFQTFAKANNVSQKTINTLVGLTYARSPLVQSAKAKTLIPLAAIAGVSLSVIPKN